ncbi:MAG: hypothetical protein JXX14_24125 [Deltaproteobacteria bacterium]|nr:hypothetical protein [Deltaproteobacteria bacterium]
MIIVLLLIAISTTGCKKKDPLDRWQVQVVVTDDESLPVPGATVRVDKSKTTTDKSGLAKKKIWGREGDSVYTDVRCPPNWLTTSADGNRLVLKKVLSDSNSADPTIVVRFRCIPRQKDHILIVKSNGKADLPVQLNGRTIARTNKDGIAQTVISGRQDEQIHLTLLTTEHPQLVPRNPSVLISLPPQRKILLFEQTFTDTPVPMPHRKRKKSRRHTGPRRL